MPYLPTKMPPFDRLSINWPEKSISTFVFAVLFFQESDCVEGFFLYLPINQVG
jgi:hypothetical protein